MLNPLKKIKEWWNRQPDIIVYQPLKLDKNPHPIPFKATVEGKHIKGFVLRQDDELRKVCVHGRSNILSIPHEWLAFKDFPEVFNETVLIQEGNELGIYYHKKGG